jgi:rare lipoprotein A (peptidoglycan hydrolase)
MKRWGTTVFCGIGILVGFAAMNAAESSDKRHAVAARQVISTDRVSHARYGGLRHDKVRHVHARVGSLQRAKAPARADRARALHRTAMSQPSRLRVFHAGRPVQQKVSAIYRLGKPYVIGGRTYTPYVDLNYRAVGKASWYGGGFHGRLTANGENSTCTRLRPRTLRCRCRVMCASPTCKTIAPWSCA